MQVLINRATKANGAAHLATIALDDECLRIYGAAPSDITCDLIIDGVLGGSGMPAGMTVDDFDAAMRVCLES